MSTVCPSQKTCVDTTTCQSQFKGKRCKCVTIRSNSETNKCDAIGTACAYEEGGVLYGCSTGCCNNQCSGQCPEESSGAPFKLGSASFDDSPTTRWGMAVIILLVALILISTISLMA